MESNSSTVSRAAVLWRCATGSYWKMGVGMVWGRNSTKNEVGME